MFKAKSTLFILLVTAIAASAFAQAPARDDGRELPTWQFWLKGNAQMYENFFQAPAGTGQDDVSAIFGEVGASLGLSRNLPLRAYGSVNLLSYEHEELDSSLGGRLGMRLDGRPHAFDVYLEQLNDRPTFDVGDEFDTADIRNLAGEYSFRFADDWQLSVDGEMQEQEFDITRSRDNEFSALGGAVRWRGSRLFSPEIGYRVGERDVNDAMLSYDQRDAYVQIRSSPVSSLYLSARFRNRSRDYSTDVLGSSYFGREDERRQLALTADWTFMPNLTLNVYAAREDVETNLPGRNFDTSLYLAGLTWRF